MLFKLIVKLPNRTSRNT